MTDFGEDVAAGDIVVTQIHSGFLIGRVMPEDGPGPWWQYLRTIADQEQAFAVARELAAAAGTRAWSHLQGDHYRQIS